MNYNTSRPKLIISEYGRHIQKLVNHAVQLEDKEERNKMVKAIIDVMGQLNPHLRDVPDFAHKLWDHIYIMSDFQLEADSPYPVPQRDTLVTKPNKMSYPNSGIRFKHYGKTVELMVGKAIEMEEGEEKNAFVEAIANLMKKHYLSWNRNSVNDENILEDLRKISRGKLTVPENIVLASSTDLVTRNTSSKSSNNKKRKRKQAYKKKKY